MKRVAVSILNYNSAQSTVNCVQSLLDAEPAIGAEFQLEIFVADNASDVQHQHYLQNTLPESSTVHLQINAKNIGFSAGHNQNIRKIFSGYNPDYVWVLNNDCIVYPETLSALITSAQRYPDVGIWGATLIESDGEEIQCAGGCLYNAWVSSYRPHGQRKALAGIGRLAPVDFDYIAGASLFFPAVTLHEGFSPAPSLEGDQTSNEQCWLNESFFLYFEELDLAKRLRPNYRMAWCKQALIRHEGGGSIGGDGRHKTTLAEYHSTLSALKFTRMHFAQRLWFTAPARFFSNCLLLIARGQPRLIGAMTKAYWDFWIK